MAPYTKSYTLKLSKNISMAFTCFCTYIYTNISVTTGNDLVEFIILASQVKIQFGFDREKLPVKTHFYFYINNCVCYK